MMGSNPPPAVTGVAPSGSRSLGRGSVVNTTAVDQAVWFFQDTPLGGVEQWKPILPAQTNADINTWVKGLYPATVRRSGGSSIHTQDRSTPGVAMADHVYELYYDAYVQEFPSRLSRGESIKRIIRRKRDLNGILSWEYLEDGGEASCVLASRPIYQAEPGVESLSRADELKRNQRWIPFSRPEFEHIERASKANEDTVQLPDSVIHFHVFIQRNMNYPSFKIRFLRPRECADKYINRWPGYPLRVRAGANALDVIPEEVDPSTLPQPLSDLTSAQFKVDPVSQEPFIDHTRTVVKLVPCNHLLYRQDMDSLPNKTCVECRTVFTGSIEDQETRSVIPSCINWLVANPQHILNNVVLLTNGTPSCEKFIASVRDFLAAGNAAPWFAVEANRNSILQQISLYPELGAIFNQYLQGGAYKLKKSKRQLLKRIHKSSQKKLQNKSQKKIQKRKSKKRY